MRTFSAFAGAVLVAAACSILAAGQAATAAGQAVTSRQTTGTGGTASGAQTSGDQPKSGQPTGGQVAATGQAATVGQAATAGNAENGKQLFMKKNCYYCHGTAGQGGRDGARISNVALSAQQLVRYVRQPAGAMPAYGEKIISEQELMDIYAYLTSLPAAKAAKDIPLLDQLR